MESKYFSSYNWDINPKTLKKRYRKFQVNNLETYSLSLLNKRGFYFSATIPCNKLTLQHIRMRHPISMACEDHNFISDRGLTVRCDIINFLIKQYLEIKYPTNL